MYKAWLHQYTQFVALAAFFLIIAGGLVTSTGSGLSVPDWPLSYGQVFPPMIGGIRFEHTHRLMAALVGFLTLGLMILILIKENNPLIRAFGILAFISVVLQAVLGGLTVIYLLPTPISVFHACLGQTFFCVVAAIVLFTSSGWSKSRIIASPRAESLQRLLIVTTIFIYLQLIAGAIVRHSPGSTIRYHFALALLIAMHVLFVIFKISKEEGVRIKLFRHAAFLGLLVIFQTFLGFSTFIFMRFLERPFQPGFTEVLLRTTHQSTGALILATAFTLSLRSLRFIKQAPSL